MRCQQNSLYVYSLLWWGLAAAVAPLHAVEVKFENSQYVAEPGSAFYARVVIDHDGRAPENLFSYGVRVIPSATSGLTVGGISVPSELDYNGFGPGAEINVSPGVLGAKGNVGSGGYYGGSPIATYTLSFDQPGSYSLDLAIYRTLGSTEQVFVDGNGASFDDDIVFGSATVTVIAASDLEAPDPRLSFVGPPSDRIDVTFDTVAGIPYTLQTNTTLLEANWADLAVDIPGDGNPHTFEHLDGAAAARRFYRTVVQVSEGPP